ncbi:MAG: prepilin-type N-terminal cleavage/methylation domain-containing protein [Nitrospirota bacterium]|nr:MAG: prepilin-type N-terminal cleavage/methylation domain-containing protein [Nitrospirota bacterium]
MKLLLKIRRRSGAGFTLIEVIIALAIISTALIMIVHTVNFHLSLINRHEVTTIATMLGTEKLRTVTAEQREKTGNFPDPYSEYSYEIEIKDSPFDNVQLVEVAVKIANERIVLSKFSGKR